MCIQRDVRITFSLSAPHHADTQTVRRRNHKNVVPSSILAPEIRADTRNNSSFSLNFVKVDA
jgi:hypothetical protein